MRKFITIIVTIVAVIGFGSTAFANHDDSIPDDTGVTTTEPYAGTTTTAYETTTTEAWAGTTTTTQPCAGGCSATTAPGQTTPPTSCEVGCVTTLPGQTTVVPGSTVPDTSPCAGCLPATLPNTGAVGTVVLILIGIGVVIGGGLAILFARRPR